MRPLPLLLLAALTVLACGTSKPAGGTTTGAPGTSNGSGLTSGSGGNASNGSAAASTGGNSASSGSAAASSGSSSTSSGSGATSSTGGSSGSSGATLPDPAQPGPYAVAELDDSFAVAATGDTVPIHCAYPLSGPAPGPFPVVVMAHGFQLPPSQYAAYLRQLASHGYVALTVDFPAGFGGVNNVDEAKDLLGGLDWAAGNATVGPLADVNRAGMSGHSLGGKLALLAATFDARVKAAVVFDPVDGSMGCSAASCPDVAPLMPGLHIPTGFLGELTDSGSNDCAPAAQNFQTIYAQTNAPSFAVTLNGANHMSFLDDTASCGFVCSVCTPATVPDGPVHALALAYLTAFYERNLRGVAAEDAYLTGAQAQSRYVATGQASITSR